MVIDTLELKIIVDNKGTTARINNTTNALKNLHKVISDINGAGGVNGAVNGVGGGGSSSRGSSSRSSGSKSASSLMKSLNFGSMVAKLYFLRNITKQLGQNLAKVVQYGIDYEETLNLWQTAMRGNISQARVFTSEMTKAYGISSATLMNYQATFKNMLSALGNISETTAYGLSEALTQMALDFSSLYNVSVESAMTKFQAVLSGQVRPIRTAGYDITEQTLFQLYQSIGGTKTVRQLNQTEKQLLRILAVYKQMERSGATGDLAKTLSISTANQLRMMNEQAKEFATWIGVAFNTMLSKSGILIEINAWLYAGVALAKQFAIEMGYVEKDYGISWSDDIADASDEYEKFKGKLLGFDKFQVLGSVANDDVDIEQNLLNAIEAYKSVFNKADNPALERSLEILKQMGLELDENGNIVGGFDDLLSKAESFAKVLSVILFTITLVANPWLAIAGAIEFCYWTNDKLRESLNSSLSKALVPMSKLWESITGHVGNMLTFLSPILFLIADILDILSPMLDIIRVIYDITVALPMAIGAKVLAEPLQFVLVILEAILKVVRSIVEVVSTLFTFDFVSLGDRLSNVWGDWNFTGKKFSESMSISLPATFRANGGLATKGSLFYAGEAGPELVTQTSGGGSTIMNMKQLEDAVARGFIRGFASTDNGYEDNDETNVYVDGQRLFNIMRNTAKRNGYDFVRV